MAILKIKQANGAWLPVEDPTALHVNNPQTLDADQQEKVRQAIGAASSVDLSEGLGTKLDLPEDPRNLSGEDSVYFGENNIAVVATIAGMEYGANGGFETNFVISLDPAQTWQGPGLTKEKNYSEAIVVARESRSGQIKVPETPSADNDATSRKYVDEGLNEKISLFSANNNFDRLIGQQAGKTTARTWNISTTVAAANAGGIPYYNPSQRSDNTIASGHLVTGIPQYATDCTNKQYVDDNFINKSGDATLTGSLVVTGDLTIRGTTKTQDAQTQLIAENIIELNSGKIDNSTYLSGLAINKNSESTYGIMYDPVSDAVKLGLGKTENGEFSFNTGEGTPLATRQEFDNSWEDDAIFVFDKTTKKFKYSGKTLSSFKEEIKADMAAYIETYMSQTVLTYEDGSTALSVSGETQEIQNESGGTTLVVGTDY